MRHVLQGRGTAWGQKAKMDGRQARAVRSFAVKEASNHERDAPTACFYANGVLHIPRAHGMIPRAG